MAENESPDFLQGGPALGADGKLEGRLNRIESGVPSPLNDAPLELEERPPKRPEAAPVAYSAALPVPPAPPAVPKRPEAAPVAYRAPLPTPSRRLARRLIAVAVVAGVALLVAGLLASRPARPGNVVHTNTLLDSLLSGGPKAPVVITSEPAGATVKIAGQVVGVTPWAGDNLWAGDTPVVLELEGFQAWKGTLKGGQEAHVNARLTK